MVHYVGIHDHVANEARIYDVGKACIDAPIGLEAYRDPMPKRSGRGLSCSSFKLDDFNQSSVCILMPTRDGVGGPA